MVRKLTGKVAIITASTNGIGFAIAKRLLNDGAKVVISSRNQHNVTNALKTLEKYGDNNSILGLVCHVAKQEDRNQLFGETIKKYGRLDYLVSNAAANPAVGPILDCAESAWDKIFEVNVKSSFLLAKEAWPYLRKNQNGGSIVFISSVAGYDPLFVINFFSDVTTTTLIKGIVTELVAKNVKPLGAYSVSKSALFSLTKAISHDLAVENIRVNCVAPGIVETKFSQPLHGNESVREQMLTQIPLNRVGQPDEIAGTIAFLLSDDASYITGETIVVAGGMRSRL